MGNVVVYGSDFMAFSAAASAARFTDNVILISPSPIAKLGGIGTIGGQNFFDTRPWGQDKKQVQKGTFKQLLDLYGQFYNTDTMANYLSNYLTSSSLNVTIYHCYDITSVTTVSNPYRISAVTIKSISRNSAGNIVWGTSTQTITGDIFIDASVEGRLARTVNSAVTTGRYDWPSNTLDTVEQGTNYVARQQAATLMFKVTGVVPNDTSDMSFPYDDNTNARCAWGGTSAYKNNSVIKSFNNAHAPSGYMIKPVNAAQNGPGSTEWWVNAFLIFDVDGRANFRDLNTSYYPSSTISGYKTTDAAWIAARNFLKNESSYLNALRQYDGFSQVDFVYDSDGYPVVGEVLYIRETVHMSMDSSLRGNNTENTNYQITANESLNAGSSATSSAADYGNYANRIGLLYYYADVHPYKYTDLRSNQGEYLWSADSWNDMRGNMFTSDTPTNPVYAPYECLLSGYVANLLIPGYAANISSLSWGEARVFPNLMVLGDAAGVAAAVCKNNDTQPLYITQTLMQDVQSKLVNTIHACLDKDQAWIVSL